MIEVKHADYIGASKDVTVTKDHKETITLVQDTEDVLTKELLQAYSSAWSVANDKGYPKHVD